LSTQNNKLLFFDKEGYPYNLAYDESSEEWSGKIYFDENSSDTFKTLCLYVFENVDAYNFTETFDLKSSQLFNFSGMTFVPSTLTGETITNIQKVNNSPLFYSKWVYGDRFDKKFPIGTVVRFHNLTGTTSYYHPELEGWSPIGVSGSTYYNVLGSKKDAILITTYTNNRDFDFVFSGGTISSVDVIKIPDYGNQKLVDLSNLNYYEGKKITIQGSENNDAIYTYKDYNVLKTKIYDFLLPDTTFNTGSTLDLNFYLMTQRPELYEGDINITYIDNSVNGTIIEFKNYINTNIDFTTTGQTIIFEKLDGSPIDPANPEFIINGFVDKDFITIQNLNFYYNEEISIIETASAITYTGLTYNDYIEVVASPYVAGGTLHDKRQFQILNVTDNKMQVRGYIIPETGYTYTINKIINKKKIRKLYCQQNAVLTPNTFSGYAVCHSTSNNINLSQSILPSGSTTYFYENTISALRNKYKTLLDRYGLNVYHYNMNDKNYLMFEGLDYNYYPYYSGATAKINNTPLLLENNFTYLTTGSSVMDSDVFYITTTEKLKTYEKINFYDSANLAKNFLLEIYFNIEKDSSDYGFNVVLNNIDYYISISGESTTYSYDTINSFISKYYDIFNSMGITVYSGYTNDVNTGYTLKFEGQQPNVYLYDINVKVNNYSDYNIITQINNKSVVIDSSELYLADVNKSLYDYELSTGMVIDISNSDHIINNKQYNILKVTPNTLQLSYQGPFFYEYNKDLNISINSFLRTPRGGYDDNSYYKFSWKPIEENSPQISPDIFYYDYSGEQLKNNGELTYLGPKPLWSNSSDSIVFLNSTPNTNIEKVYDPEYQQIVFEELYYKLENLNSSINYNYVPIPMQVFIGFNSKLEGVIQNNLILEKVENIIFSGTTSNISGSTTYINNFSIYTGETSSYIEYFTTQYNFSFNNMGFEKGQTISLNFVENTITGHTLFGNYGNYTIEDVTDKKITVTGLLLEFDSSLSGKTFDFIIKTEPDKIASIGIFGQTEVEDERFVQHLKLLGANLEAETQHIFKESDINDIGIDYTILNRKRKELLSVYPEIYNYIGSYKALINSINFFGYNDLDLYEYYRCVKPNSPLYGKLQKVLIEDIFINTIPGWDEPEIDSANYLKTNLFNLTYKITDFDGNYIEIYSLDEVQRKLTKMVTWLRQNVIPLSANILDITGIVNTSNTLYMNYNASNYAKKITVNQTCASVNFVHIQTLNIDTNYLFTINFYLTTGSVSPDYWTAKIITFHLNETTNELEPVQYIKLYKTDLKSYSFNVDSKIDPYMYIETQTYNEYGLGYTNNRLFNYNEGRNFVLINNNFKDVNYKYVTDYYGYYIISDGRFYIIKY